MMMESNLICAQKMLREENLTCVIYNGEKSYTSTLRGVKPLVMWYEACMDFTGFCAADKVVGKGAAFLYLLLGVTAIHAGVISRSALDLLIKNNIHVEYDLLVKNIINRNKDGICPFEEAVLDIEDKFLAYTMISRKLDQMNISYKLEG